MTPEAAIQRWLTSFGIPVYAAAATPDQAVKPYLTYGMVYNGWGDGEVSMEVRLWYYTESEAIPNAKAREIHEALGFGGVYLQCDGGAIWLKRGTPFCQSTKDDSGDDKVKGRYINVDMEFMIA